MITTKQRANLRKKASILTPIMQVGKDVIKDESIKQIEDMLEKRELVKIRVLNNCELNSKQVATLVQEKTNCEIVQVIGKIFVIYRKSSRNDIEHINLEI